MHLDSLECKTQYHEVDDDKRYDARQGCKREHTLVVYPEFGLIRGTYISGGRQATNPLDQEVFIHSKVPGVFAPFGALSRTTLAQAHWCSSPAAHSALTCSLCFYTAGALT
ncbi:hypothetical protein YC2023_014962 [Brassica napus]